jgi:peptidoglycan/LPS O-acetylase OafA/YrhL
MSTGQHLPALDGIRGLAVLMVVAGHISIDATHYLANAGVTIFFVLSGFLITSLLVREKSTRGKVDLKAFYMRRVLRLYPALLLLLLLTPVLMLIARDTRIDEYPQRALISGLYLSDFAEASGYNLQYFTHTWSLAIEEQYYLVWPAVLLLLIAGIATSAARNKRRTLLVAVLGLTGLAIAWRVLATLLLDQDRVYFSPDTNVFVLLLGCSLALVPRDALQRVPAWVGNTALVLAVALSVLLPAESDVTRNWVVLGVAVLAVVGVAGATGSNAPLSLRPLMWFGVISYGFYLWHNVFLDIHWWSDEPTGGIRRVLLVAIALGFAVASFYLLERPVLRLKRRWERSSLPVANAEPTAQAKT